MDETRLEKGSRKALSDPTPMDVDGDQGDCVITRIDTSPISFYHRGEPFFEFTNFSLHSIEYQGKIYATAEHLFQAFKFMKTDPAIAELMRTQHSARAARSEARFQRAHQRSDWFDVNVEVMDTVLSAKFTQHEDLRRTLLETGDRELIEDSPDDVFWGIGRDGQGRNELGKALMRLRGQLREPPDPSPGANDVVSPS
ncbi:hypothetical protein BC827DRAFT_1183897 [Russula dissimulans]|nr:hypothetical protein BC827DRAFT_1183897 [Russula dissimulans]